ncbi:hypothetical protein HMJ29_10755 [Hymenobacter taeanensis]|uniref:Exo-alpha-sialidase n=1 Tax=Hymenobacter taeanensis TaxID=2735321 RepID=A0A6M6BHC7_9BACT|nr:MULTISPECIES: hypothetical protein [Hymenobacter]QJX47392.1 hypothetical protein HMJ29_10755 [Hymenobacter taeanensis]UOQ79268.1 hypothetical protein MUN83_10355 [Hymenobacter sp. 5414T-23]
MHTTTKILLAIIGLTGGTACTKEVEKLVIQEPVYSWAEVKQLTGSQKIIIQLTTDKKTLFLQQPGIFGHVTPLANVPRPPDQGYFQIKSYSSDPLPYDIQNRLPMNASLFLKPAQVGDSVLQVYTTANPPLSNQISEIRLRRVDKSADKFVNNRYSPYAAFGAISSNNYSLVGYTTAPADRALHFVLSKLTLPTLTRGAVDVTSRTVSIPLDNASAFYTISAIDDYFLVSNANDGIYKIRENGTVRRVFSSPQIFTTAYYKDRSTLYAIQGDNQYSLLTSTDDGETWQRSTGLPNFFRVSTFYPVGDSIVGVSHGAPNNVLYTLRWQGATYRVRELKSDGLNQADFTDLVQLGDTVYLGTTNGLFKRPLKTFFESKPKE